MKARDLCLIVFILLVILANEKKLYAKDLNICTTGEYKPILYILKTGEFVGVHADILKGFSKKENLNLKYLIFSFKSLIPALLTKKCDMIASGMIATGERKKLINFSNGIYTGKSYIIYLKNNLLLKNIKTKNDFNSKSYTMGILSGSIYETNIEKNNFAPKVVVQKYESQGDVSLALITKKIDFTVDGSQFLKSIINAQKNKISFMPVEIAGGDIAFGLRKDNETLLGKINVYLNEIKKNGEYKKIIDKYEVYHLP
jgi:polar amino acid transport system substrate-binding protein